MMVCCLYRLEEALSVKLQEDLFIRHTALKTLRKYFENFYPCDMECLADGKAEKLDWERMLLDIL
jgi:hypothetical protein